LELRCTGLVMLSLGGTPYRLRGRHELPEESSGSSFAVLVLDY
jgi:hypothetical protein